MNKHFPRFIKRSVLSALADTPVVCILGPRQVGKTTLCREIATDRAYFTFDDISLLKLAKRDPEGFVQGLPEFVTLDEVQRVPELLFAIKQDVDQNRKPGRYLLTGSANLLLLSRVKESLAGRIEIIAMHPLSEAEKNGQENEFLKRFFHQEIAAELSSTQTTVTEIAERICQGGFPEPVARSANRARRWHEQYLQTLMQNDVRDIASIHDHHQLQKLAEFLALRTGQLLNVSAVANDLQLNRETVDKYITILENLFLIYRLPAWNSNRSKRLIKTPKLHVVDSGLAAMLHRLSADQWLASSEAFGQLLESFVIQQLRVQATWLDDSLQFSHYRDKDQKEVDLVIERGTAVYGIEIKKSRTIQSKDGAGLRLLAAKTQERFKGGVIFYCGDHVIPLEEPYCFAVPITRLWQT